MTAAIGNVVSLYMDTSRDIEFGDCIRTTSGRAYRVVASRQQERGKHAGRWHLRAQVIDASTISEDDTVIPLMWYRR